MAKRSKYADLTEWLQKSSNRTVRLSFDELNTITIVPKYAYNDRPSWANCTTQSASPFQKGWMKAGYLVAAVSLQDEWVEFSKGDIIPSNIQFIRRTPDTIEDELLLTIPSNLIQLEKDQYLMVQLSKTNSDIVEACIEKDPRYQSKGIATMHNYFDKGDYSVEAYYAIINCIASENSTRTSTETMKQLAELCADPAINFLKYLKEGCPELVDELLKRLIDLGNRKEKSLVSKLCRYLNEWIYDDCAYTINDSVVRAILPYYLAYYKIDRAMWHGKRLEDLSYVEFYKIFTALRDCVPELNNHRLDHLIWYAYKNDSIRSEVAKALAEVI